MKCKTHTLISLAVAAALAPSLCLATDHPSPAPTPTTSTANSGSVSGATALSGAKSSSNSASVSGSKSASTSNSASTSAVESQVDASNANNLDIGGDTLSIDGDHNPRQLPSVYAPTVFPSIGCGRGVSIGGTGLTAGGAVAFTWSNKDCEDFARHVSYAQAMQAVGQSMLACDVLLAMPMAQQVWGDRMPTCTVPVPAAAPVAEAKPQAPQIIVIDPSNLATKQDVAAAFKQGLAK